MHKQVYFTSDTALFLFKKNLDDNKYFKFYKLIIVYVFNAFDRR